MPKRLIGEEEMVCPNSPKPNVVPGLEEDEPTEASWVTKGNKRQKIVHIPIEVNQRSLQILPSKNRYFSNLRKIYIQDRIKLAKNTLTDLELVAARLDDKIIQAQKFMEDDDFIKSAKFKNFLYKIK